MKRINIPKSEWVKRRFRLDLALVSILILVCWIVFSGTDSVLYQQVSIALIAGGVSLIGTYIFGAAWDDKNYMDAITKDNENNQEYINTGITDVSKEE